jgi:S-adenosylmethionine hydrolase
MKAPVITFLSDYGHADEFVGVCHAVIARRCPPARIIDLTHGIARHDVRAGALALRAALPYCPRGAVHLAVVDPGVGTSRRAVLLRCEANDSTFVGPDNGLLWPATTALGGVSEAYDIGGSSERLEPVSKTFHGRDLFAPVAAAVAAGIPPSELGVALAPAELVRLEPSQPRRDGSRVIAHVVSIDAFGNVALDLDPADLGERAELRLARTTVPFVGSFAELAPGELLAYRDSRGAIALAVNGGSAAQRLRLAVGDELQLEQPA